MIAVTLIPRSTEDALRSLERLADVKSPLLSAAKGGDRITL